MPGKRDYISGLLLDKLGELNSYLREQGASFSIPDQRIGLVRIYFDGAPPEDGRIWIESKEEVPKDPYAEGRAAGSIIHNYHNPNIFTSKTKRSIKVRMVVEHAFAMLNILREDPEADILEMQKTYESARDKPMGYSIMDETDERFGENMARFMGREKKGGEGEKKVEGFDTLFEGLKDLSRKFGIEIPPGLEANVSGSGLDFVAEDSGFVPGDLTGYIERELATGGVSDHASDILEDKRRDEEFHTARIVIEGHGDGTKNWRRVFGTILAAREGEAVKYLVGLYHY